MSDYTEKDGVIKPENLQVVDIPLFLEGPVRYLKLPQTHAAKEALYEKVKASDMYDKKLDMYKVNALLRDWTCACILPRLAGERIHLAAYGVQIFTGTVEVRTV